MNIENIINIISILLVILIIINLIINIKNIKITRDDYKDDSKRSKFLFVGRGRSSGFRT